MIKGLPFEDFEKIAEYDLGGQILEDCAYLSHKSTLEAVEIWWKRNGDFILEACLEKVRNSEGVTTE